MRDGQFALAADAHALYRILVDAADHHCGAVGAQQRHDGGEAFLAVFQVDRIDDGLAGRVFQRQLDHRRFGGIDHQRHAHFAGDEFEEVLHVGVLVAVGIGQADVQYLGAALDLGATDVRGALKLAGADEVAEPPGADDVGTLTDDDRAIVGLQRQVIQAGDGHDTAARRRLRPFALRHVGQHFDVLRRGAAAAAGDVQPAVVDEAFELRGE